jgi:Lrp/AsnC family transcriptional regulator for asnA, asnC and gidA
MEKIDVKDRKILYELDLDSRQSFRAIGKKVGLSKDVVGYRVKKLQEKGIIREFQTHTNTSGLGYAWYRFYFNCQYVSPKIMDEIVDYFVKAKYAHAVLTTEGTYDLVVNTHTKEVPKAYFVWENILSKYRDYFANQVFSVIYKSYSYDYPFLLDSKDKKRTKRKKTLVCGSEKTVEIDDLDHKILKLITSNSRMPTIDIAKKLDSTVNTINSRIKKLIKKKVIESFRILIDFPKLGYHLYKADVVLRDHGKINKIIEYIENNPNLEGIIRSIGYVDLELVFILNNVNQLHEIMKDLSEKFPDTIKNYSNYRSIKTHKWGRTLD